MQIRSFNNKNLWWVILALAIALLWLIFRPLTPGDKQKPMEVVTVDVRAIDSLMILLHEYRDTLLAMRARESAANKKLVQAGDKLATMARKYEAARIHRDTPGALLVCDSMAAENKELVNVIEEQQEAHQAADSARDVQDIRKDSVIAGQAVAVAQYHQLYRSAVDSTNLARGQVNKLQRQKKIEKTVTRVLAVGALVLGGLLLIK